MNSDITSETLPPVITPLGRRPSTQIERETLDMLMMQIACLKEELARRDRDISELKERILLLSDKLPTQMVGLNDIKPEACKILEFLADHDELAYPSIDALLKAFELSYKVFLAHFCILRELDFVRAPAIASDSFTGKEKEEKISIWITPKGRIFLLNQEITVDQ